jgi:hypothetical protein
VTWFLDSGNNQGSAPEKASAQCATGKTEAEENERMALLETRVHMAIGEEEAAPAGLSTGDEQL